MTGPVPAPGSREALADLIYKPKNMRSIGAANYREQALMCADVILAAGWRPPLAEHDGPCDPLACPRCGS